MKLIVVGASWGGVDALTRLTAGLPADLNAAVLVVLHIGAGPSQLPQVIATRARLPVCYASDGEEIRPSRVYVATPDHHLMVVDGVMSLTRGPKEHHTRPAIDPLFRSAALARGGSVIGVVLTGMMDDGTEGLQAIKACGGTTIVQSPHDAFCPEMPLSAMNNVQIDHCLPLEEMPALLSSLSKGEDEEMPIPPPERLVHEQAIVRGDGDPLTHLQQLGSPTTFTCPDCQGSLWQINGAKRERFVCHTGHGYSLKSLMQASAVSTDEAVWKAVRALQENSLLLRHAAEHERALGNVEEAKRLATLAEDMQLQADTLRRLVQREPGGAEQATKEP